MLAHGLNALISMVLLFFLFALLVSAVMEAISSFFKLRGQSLKICLEMLLDDSRAKGWGGLGAMDRITGNRMPEAVAGTITGASLFDAIFKGSLVGGIRPTSRPTYIEPRQFAMTLLDQFRTGAVDDSFKDIATSIGTLPDGRLKDTLSTLANDAAGDYDALKTNVALWFDEAMSRLSGEYKRLTQFLTFAIAFALAIAFNVNAVHVGERLLTDRLLAETMAEIAIQEVEKQKALPAAAAADDPVLDFKQKVASQYQARADLFKAYPFLGYTEKQTGPFSALAQNGFISLIGWLLMAFSAVIGAPFWFDLLQRFINIRGAGPKPGTTTPGDGT